MANIDDVLGGRYRLTALLGQGGMSDVFRAVDEVRADAVAVKVVRSADPDLARRLEQEVRALERLDHPGLVRLLDTGVVGEQPYLVMELVEGTTLAGSMRCGPLDPAETARIGVGVAGALSYVHGHGIVHRDVKPANILLDVAGRPRLGDFGVARMLAGGTLTVAGTTLGTAAYMAPEQLEDHRVGPAADVWALGIVLLECLTGHRVYGGSPGEVISRRLAGPVPIPGDLPIPWQLVLSGMLDHRPERRLDGDQVAALLATPAMATAWEPPSDPDRVPTALYDLTALAPARGTAGSADPVPATRVLPIPEAAGVPPFLAGTRGLSRVRSFSDVIGMARSLPPHWRRRALLALLLVAAVIVVLVVVLVIARGPGAHTSRSVAGTATNAAVPAGHAALATLLSDVAEAVARGSATPSSVAAISGPADQAVAAKDAGNTAQAVTDLEQAATAIAAGDSSGSVDRTEGARLQEALGSLATALGLGGSATPTTTTTATTTTTTAVPAATAPPPAPTVATPGTVGGPPGKHGGGKGH